MKIVQGQQKMVHFNNGKTFFVDFSTRNHANLCQSLAVPSINQNVHPSFLPPSAPSLLYRSNAQPMCQVGNKEVLSRGENLVFKQLFFPSSHYDHYDRKIFTELKMASKCSSNVSLDACTDQTTSSKKHRIFSAKSQQYGTKRSLTSIKPFKMDRNFQKFNQINEVQKSDLTTNPSKNICFSRKNETKTNQQIPSYQKRSFNIIQRQEFQQKIITTSQPINRPETYVQPILRCSSVNARQKINFVAQVQSKHYIPVHQTQRHLIISNKQTQNHNELKKRKDLLSRQKKQQKRPIQVKNNRKLKHFCQESTMKISKKPQKSSSPKEVQQISNIQQNNSFSRYFDTQDDLLPLLNKISYKNVDIVNQSYEKAEEIATHNIFMDFQKAPISPHQPREIVHFDYTLNKENARNEQAFRVQKYLKLNLMQKLPYLLVLATIVLLLVQIIS